MGRRRNDPAEDDWIREVYPHHKVAETARLFEERFGRAIKPNSLSAWANDLGVRRDIGHISWEDHPEWVEWLAGFIPGHSEREIIDGFKERWGIELRIPQIANFKRRHGVKSYTTGGRFAKGHMSQNKGKPISEWMSPEQIANFRASQFKKGIMPHNSRPMGYERVNVDGYIEVKVRERPEPGKPNTFDLKHRLVYEKAHNVELTDDDVVVFLDGNKLNCEPSNLARLSHADHAKMTAYGLTYSDRETFDTALNIIRLNDRIRDYDRRERTCPVCGKRFKPTNPSKPSVCCSKQCAGIYRRGKPVKRRNKTDAQA